MKNENELIKERLDDDDDKKRRILVGIFEEKK
jgi:hypothetical protein